jgi:hypothetical protein
MSFLQLHRQLQPAEHVAAEQQQQAAAAAAAAAAKHAVQRGGRLRMLVCMCDALSADVRAHSCMADSMRDTGARKRGDKEPNAGGQVTIRSDAGAHQTVPAGFTCRS